jgi:hypothetical protein
MPGAHTCIRFAFEGRYMGRSGRAGLPKAIRGGVKGLTPFRIGLSPAGLRSGGSGASVCVLLVSGGGFAICAGNQGRTLRAHSSKSGAAAVATTTPTFSRSLRTRRQADKRSPSAELDGCRNRRSGEDRDLRCLVLPCLPVVSRALLRLTAKHQPGRALQHGGLLLPLRALKVSAPPPSCGPALRSA